ncbi:MAG TPA: PAS domain S-box protein, partial [Thermoplasmata archaeon]|nr:PAS domain S-box protein [Thermoplasmata archaeon]
MAMRYRELFGRIRDGFVRIDGEGRIVEWNRPFGELLGYPDEELSRRSIADLTPERWRDLDESMFLGQVMTRGHSEPYLKELTRADGTAVPVEVVVYRHEAVGEGDVEGAWILVREVSERVRMERELAQRLDLEDLIMTISNDFINVPSNKIDAEIDHALLLIGEFSGVDRSYVFQFSADGGTMSNTHEWCAEGIISYIGDLQDIPVDRFPWVVRRMREKEVVHCDDVAELPPEAGPEREELERQGILSIVLVPMSLRGEVIGFVGFDAVRGRQSWSDESIALLRIVGDIFANALDRKRTEEALRMSEEKYRATVETSINSIFMADPDTKSLIEWNSSVKRLLAYDDGELAGMALYDLFDETREETDRWVERLREKGGLDLGERRLRRRDGTLVGVEANAALLPTDGR